MTQPLPPLIVPVEDVAKLAGLDPTDEAVQFAVEVGIRAATTQAEGHLCRPVVPLELTQTGVRPAGRSWALEFTPREVLSVVDEVDGDGYLTGLFTVTYTVGIDAREPQYGVIREWVKAAAQVYPAVRRQIAAAQLREVRSVSAEGQSVQYEPTPPPQATPTAGVPPMTTMDYWRSTDGLAWQRRGRLRRRKT